MQSGDVIIAGTFKKNVFNIELTQGSGGTISAISSQTVGEEVTVTTTPDTGYQLKTLKVGNTDITSTKKFTMPNNAVTITVEWEKIPYTITLSSGTGGTISASKNPANYGDTITITTTPTSGYSLTSLKVGSTDITTTKKFTMALSSVTVTATWKRNNVTLSSITTSNGRQGCAYLSSENAANSTSFVAGNSITATIAHTTSIDAQGTYGIESNAYAYLVCGSSTVTITSSGTNSNGTSTTTKSGTISTTAYAGQTCYVRIYVWQRTAATNECSEGHTTVKLTTATVSY